MLFRSATKVLTGAGYRVLTASHAANALRIVNAGLDVVAVISDLLMPGMDGFELKYEIDRARDKPMPFLLLTGSATPENRAIAERLALSEFAAKPLKGSSLVQAVERLLERAKSA